LKRFGPFPLPPITENASRENQDEERRTVPGGHHERLAAPGKEIKREKSQVKKTDG
jgi:hypothetical protein